MDKTEIIKIVNHIFEEEFEIPPENIKEDSRIFEDLELDSLDIVDFVVALEKEFKVKVKSRESLSEIKTVKDIYQFIDNEQKKLIQND